MDLKTAKELFKQTDKQRSDVIKRLNQGRAYYKNQNDITRTNQGESVADAENENETFRKHDSRISSNHQQLLIDQKASHAGSKAPQIDVDNEDENERIMDALGDRYQSIVQRLIVEASLGGVAWLHVWNDEDNKFRYGLVTADQITPIYSDSVEKKLLAVRRTYKKLDAETGKTFIHDEYWTDEEAYLYKREEKDTDNYDTLIEDISVPNIDTATKEIQSVSNVRAHGMGSVPFIQFSNNHLETGDLEQYKGQIDAYDIVMNGFINDVVDVQQVILVLSGYGNEPLDKFVHELKERKVIKMDSDDDDVKSGVEQLTIDIPVEARNSLLDKLSDDIYKFGQGLDPTKLQAGTAMSGVALKMMYSGLEMKCAKVESEFRPGINRLVRFVLENLGLDRDKKIKQTWTRSSIQNETEQAAIVAQLALNTSKENVARANPIVSDWQEELKLRKKETMEGDGFEEKGNLDG